MNKACRSFLLCLTFVFSVQQDCFSAQKQIGYGTTFKNYTPWMLGGAGFGGALGYSAGRFFEYDAQRLALIAGLTGFLGAGLYKYKQRSQPQKQEKVEQEKVEYVKKARFGRTVMQDFAAIILQHGLIERNDKRGSVFVNSVDEEFNDFAVLLKLKEFIGYFEGRIIGADDIAPLNCAILTCLTKDNLFKSELLLEVGGKKQDKRFKFLRDFYSLYMPFQAKYPDFLVGMEHKKMFEKFDKDLVGKTREYLEKNNRFNTPELFQCLNQDVSIKKAL